jgi:hypothetical protein
MNFETLASYLLTAAISFAFGAIAALFWAYAGHGARLVALESGKIGKVDLSAMQTEITHLNTTIMTMGIVDLAANVKVMKESIIFDRDFQQKLSTVCSEHKDMHDQINKDGGRLIVLETKAHIKPEE